MEFLYREFDLPEENIAYDKLLLEQAELGKKDKALHFWELKDYVVITGRGSSVGEDVYTERCKKDNIKIIQRASGGGCVLLGKGCLNYSLLLPLNAKVANIKGSFKYIIEGIITNFKKINLDLVYQPVSDIALDNKKVSGNAQARKRKFMLMHGTFLYDFDIDRVAFYLKEPKKAPLYRNGRKHKDFLTNIPSTKEEIKEIIKEALSRL